MKAVVLDFATAEVIIIDADWTKAKMQKHIETKYDDANTQYMFGDNIKIKRQKL